MPDDRFLHRRAGHSQRVNMLTDLEYRVWTQYVLSADDFGVMRGTHHPIQNDNDHLSNRPARAVKRCIDALVHCGLIRAFDHQGKPYVFQHDWQDWQKVTYPRPTTLPSPPASELARCTEATQELFGLHPGGAGRKRRELSENIPETFSEDLSLMRASAPAKRLTANGLRLEANGSDVHRARFEQFWVSYPRRIGKDAAWREWLKRSPSDDLTALMIRAVERDKASPQWRKDDGQYIPNPRTWLHQGRWQDEPVTDTAPVPFAPWHCPHIEPCGAKSTCARMKALNRPERAVPA